MFVFPLKIIETVLMILVCLVMAYAMFIYTAYTSEDEETQISPGITFAFFMAAFTQVLGIILIWGF